ncbi:hypothetical protein I5U65_00550 [Stenotrophomonas maltophilia]|nr:hypothetical protein [Stenotrophomonas maltophilia]
MPPQVPNNVHDSVLWLLSALENVRESTLESGEFSGVLPDDYDYALVERELLSVWGKGNIRLEQSSRKVFFYPENGAVYSDLKRMLSAQKANLTGVPPVFTLQNCNYTYRGDPESSPSAIRPYFDAVKLWRVIKGLADYSSKSEKIQHFLISREARFSVEWEYGTEDIAPLPTLDAFLSEYFDSDFHRAEKHAVIRDALLELAGSSDVLSVRRIISGFSSLERNVRASYALLLSKYTAASVGKEIAKQNLEDSLRLNKSFSDIQNQLLALPAALLIAGASISLDSPYKNYSILIGIIIFLVLMWLLIDNQRNSVAAISTEIEARRLELELQPDLVAQPHRKAFGELAARVDHQTSILTVVRASVLIVFVSVGCMVFDALSGRALTATLAGLWARIFPILWPLQH